MYLKNIRAVFQFVFNSGSFGGQLARLPHWDKSCVQTIGEGRTEDKAASFHSKDQINFFGKVVFGERVNECGETQLVFKQGGDVVKQDALFREIRNFPDQLLQGLAVHTRLRRGV